MKNESKLNLLLSNNMQLDKEYISANSLRQNSLTSDATTQVRSSIASALDDEKNDVQKLSYLEPEKQEINFDKLTDWIESEDDQEIKSIKKLLVENLNYISFEQFVGSLQFCVKKFNKLLGDKKYALMRDYKPHSSKRWVNKLIENDLANNPEYSWYFHPSAEKHSIWNLKRLIAQWVNTFVTMDDAAYSWEQILNRFVKPILNEYKDSNNPSKPEIYIIVPFITKSFKDKIDKLNQVWDCKIVLINEKIMPQIGDVVSDQDLEVLKSKRNGILEKSWEEPLCLTNTLTFFEHKVADDHSFSPEIKSKLWYNPKVPYSDESSQYYADETIAFDEYWQLYLNSMKN